MIDISLLSSRSRQLAGLDISSSSVKLVELSANDRGGLRVERYVIELLPRDAVVDGDIANFDGVADGIRRALRRFGGNPRNVAVALPATSVITKKIIMPDGLRELDMELQVESEAAQYIPFALDEVNIDFQVVGPAGTPGDIEVLVAASRKDKVEDRVGVAEAAGLKVAVVDVESLAVEAAFELVVEQLPNSARGKLVGLINIGAAMTNFTVLRDGQRVYSREQQFGGNQLTQDIARQFGMSSEEAESAKRGDNLPPEYADLLRPFMDSVALEVSRALQFFFTSTQYNAIDYLVLAGGCAVIPGLAEIVGGRTQVQTIVANPFSNMAVSSKLASKKLQAEAPSLMAACGLALRRFDE